MTPKLSYYKLSVVQGLGERGIYFLLFSNHVILKLLKQIVYRYLDNITKKFT